MHLSLDHSVGKNCQDTPDPYDRSQTSIFRSLSDWADSSPVRQDPRHPSFKNPRHPSFQQDPRHPFFAACPTGVLTGETDLVFLFITGTVIMLIGPRKMDVWDLLDLKSYWASRSLRTHPIPNYMCRCSNFPVVVRCSTSHKNAMSSPGAEPCCV